MSGTHQLARWSVDQNHVSPHPILIAARATDSAIKSRNDELGIPSEAFFFTSPLLPRLQKMGRSASEARRVGVEDHRPGGSIYSGPIDLTPLILIFAGIQKHLLRL